MEDKVPKGFFRAKDGTLRYWDGSQWLEQESAKKSLSWKKLRLFLSAVIAVIAVVIGVAAFFQNEERLRLVDHTEMAFYSKASSVRYVFEYAVSNCETIWGVDGVAYDEKRLTVDGRGKEDSSGIEIYGVVCLLSALEMPDAALSGFRDTNTLQALGEVRWGVLNDDAEVRAEWSYHPDSGPQLSLALSSVYFEKFNYEKHRRLVDQAPTN
jgi:hypothetical protein